MSFRSISLLRIRLYLTIYVLVTLSFFLAWPPNVFASQSNPFESNPKLNALAKEVRKALESQEPVYLKIVTLNQQEQEAVYQYLRGQLERPLELWSLILLDYPRLRLLRNEIFARHGRAFSSADLAYYFNAQSWYKPVENFSEADLTKSEKENVEILTRVEYVKYNGHATLGERIKFRLDKDSVSLPDMGLKITTEYTGCCGVMEGSSSVTGKNGAGFYVSFGSEGIAQGDIQYVKPLWGSVLIALISGEVQGPVISSNSKVNDRLVILDKSATPVVSIEEPYETIEFEPYHIVQLSPSLIYMNAEDRHSGTTTQSLLFLKSELPFKPNVKDLFTWLSLENTEIKSAKKDNSFVLVQNPKVLWNREIDKIDPLFAQDRLYFIKLEEGSPDLISVVDKLSGREIFSYQLPVKVARIPLKDQKGYTVTDDALVVVGNNSLHFLQLDNGQLIKTVSFEDLAKSLNIPIDRQFNYRSTDVLSYNNIVFFGKIFDDHEGQEVYLLAFDSKGNVIWTYNGHVQTSVGNYDRNGRYRYLQFLNDKICLVEKDGCDLIYLQSGKYIEHRKFEGDELEIDHSGNDQVYPKVVWQDKRKGDNYFEPRILHKDNNYIFVKGKWCFWAVGEEAIYDYLLRSEKLLNTIAK